MRPMGEPTRLADVPQNTQCFITAMLAGDTILGKVRWRRGRDRGSYGQEYHMRARWWGLRVVMDWMTDHDDRSHPTGYLSIGGCDLSDDGRCVADSVIESTMQREREAEARQDAREARLLMRVYRRVFGKEAP